MKSAKLCQPGCEPKYAPQTVRQKARPSASGRYTYLEAQEPQNQLRHQSPGQQANHPKESSDGKKITRINLFF